MDIKTPIAATEKDLPKQANAKPAVLANGPDDMDIDCSSSASTAHKNEKFNATPLKKGSKNR